GERRLPAKRQAGNATPSQNLSAHFLTLVSEDQILSLQSQVASSTEKTAQQLNRSESFSLNMRVVSGMSGETGVAVEIRGQKSEIRSQKSEVSDQRADVRLNHAASLNLGAGSLKASTTAAPFVPTPVGQFPINGT